MSPRATTPRIREPAFAAFVRSRAEPFDQFLPQRQIRLLLDPPLHGELVELLVGLGARRVHRRALGRVQHAELNAAGVDALAHHAAERVDLANDLPLGDAADGRIAAHLGDGVGVHASAGRSRGPAVPRPSRPRCRRARPRRRSHQNGIPDSRCSSNQDTRLGYRPCSPCPPAGRGGSQPPFLIICCVEFSAPLGDSLQTNRGLLRRLAGSPPLSNMMIAVRRLIACLKIHVASRSTTFRLSFWQKLGKAGDFSIISVKIPPFFPLRDLAAIFSTAAKHAVSRIGFPGKV